MTIEEFINAIEETYLEDALDKLAKNPKDMVMVYLSSLEFKRAKLMRGNAIPTESTDEERNIYVSIAGGVEDD